MTAGHYTVNHDSSSVVNGGILKHSTSGGGNKKRNHVGRSLSIASHGTDYGGSDAGALSKMMKTASTACINLFERFFNWWGITVAENPFKVMLGVVLLTAVSLFGLYNFSAESDGWKLWLPDTSKHTFITKWKEENFVEDGR